MAELTPQGMILAPISQTSRGSLSPVGKKRKKRALRKLRAKMIYFLAPESIQPLTSASLGIGVNESGIFPSLREASVVEEDVSLLEL